MAGARYAVTDSWSLSGDLRFSQAPNLDMTQENGAGRLDGVDQSAVSIAFGLQYRF